LSALRTSGLLGLVVPEEYGGLGGDGQTVNRFVAEVSRVAPSLAIILFQHCAVAARIVEWGDEEQRRRYLPRMAAGELLAASAWSEKNAGADKRDISTTAVPLTGGGWAINGSKAFTTGAGVADLYLVLAVTGDPDAGEEALYGSSGQSFFLVDADRPGVRCAAWTDLVGMRDSATGSVEFRECAVPAGAMIGPPGCASRIIAGVRESGATLGAVSVGIADAAYDLVLEHVMKRGQAAERAVRHRLVDLKVRVESARAIVELAGRRDSADAGTTTLFSKLFASEACEEICQEAARMLGSAGFSERHPINQLVRDARAVALMGPTNDLCRELASAGWVN
jgi:alkylation response protein AidB-like acyl-CoA dehydrogenase